MVGEIRDQETAGIAINVALTGHLLLSTLHTNDPATTLPRLLDMKIESYLVASTVSLVVGQKLIRKICPNCKQEKKLTEGERQSLAGVLPPELLLKKQIFYYGRGCMDCGETGYLGRMAVHEVLEVTDVIREAVLKKVSASEIKAIAVKNGMRTILEDGFVKAASSLTTIEEVLRMAYE
jgi:type IV pilus assembly protein PilB